MASSAVKKPMSSNQSGHPKILTTCNSNLKKNIETSTKQPPLISRNKSIPQKLAKSEDKGKATTSKTFEKKVVTRVKKVYTLPGQKHDPPEEDKGKATTSKTFEKKVVKREKKVVKREKKVYTLPGQKHDPPEEREPLRIFYETLSKQIPTSEMAEFWLMEHGMLSPEKAKKAYEKKQRKQKQLRTGTPIKSPPPRISPTKPESSNRPKLASKNGDAKAKRKFVDDDDDDEVIRRPKQRKT